MKISAAQRQKLLAGKRPAFPIEGKDQCPEGEVVLRRELSIAVTVLQWTGPVKKDGQFYADYTVIDTRSERLLRRVAGYTRSPSLAVEEAGQAVSKDFQDRLSREAATASARHRSDLRLQADKVRYERQLLDARNEGRRGKARVLGMKIRRVQQLLSERAA